eukprot:Opistho-2@11153
MAAEVASGVQPTLPASSSLSGTSSAINIAVPSPKSVANVALPIGQAADMVRDVLDKMYKALYENIGYDLRRTIVDPESSTFVQKQQQHQLNPVQETGGVSAVSDEEKSASKEAKDGPIPSKSVGRSTKAGRSLPTLDKNGNGKSHADVAKSLDATSPKTSRRMRQGGIKHNRLEPSKLPGGRNHYGTAPTLFDSNGLNSNNGSIGKKKAIRSSFPPIGSSMSVLTEAPAGVNVMRMGADGKPLSVLPPIKGAKSEMAMSHTDGQVGQAPQPLPLDTSAFVRMLLTGCDAREAVNRGDKQTGATPLHLAAGRNDVRTIEVLLSNKAHVNAMDNLQKTPLYEAAMHGHTLSILCLLHAGANINLPNKYGNTPLHAAVRNGHTEAACMLILLGANRLCKNNMGHTYMDRTSDPMLVASLRVQCDMDSINERIYWLRRLKKKLEGMTPQFELRLHKFDSTVNMTDEEKLELKQMKEDMRLLWTEFMRTKAVLDNSGDRRDYILSWVATDGLRIVEALGIPEGHIKINQLLPESLVEDLSVSELKTKVDYDAHAQYVRVHPYVKDTISTILDRGTESSQIKVVMSQFVDAYITKHFHTGYQPSPEAKDPRDLPLTAKQLAQL